MNAKARGGPVSPAERCHHAFANCDRGAQLIRDGITKGVVKRMVEYHVGEQAIHLLDGWRRILEKLTLGTIGHSILRE